MVLMQKSMLLLKSSLISPVTTSNDKASLIFSYIPRIAHIGRQCNTRSHRPEVCQPKLFLLLA